jgi:hypothetical protein
MCCQRHDGGLSYTLAACVVHPLRSKTSPLPENLQEREEGKVGGYLIREQVVGYVSVTSVAMLQVEGATSVAMLQVVGATSVAVSGCDQCCR